MRALPHFPGLHAFSAVISHVDKGHFADAPWLWDPYVLAAVTVARDHLIHLKHTQRMGALHTTTHTVFLFGYLHSSPLWFTILGEEYRKPLQSSSCNGQDQLCCILSILDPMWHYSCACDLKKCPGHIAHCPTLPLTAQHCNFMGHLSCSQCCGSSILRPQCSNVRHSIEICWIGEWMNKWIRELSKHIK